jgi:hypothetical protein
MTPGARKVLAIESNPERLAEIVATLAAQTTEQAAYIRALEQHLSPGYVRRPPADPLQRVDVEGGRVYLPKSMVTP